MSWYSICSGGSSQGDCGSTTQPTLEWPKGISMMYDDGEEQVRCAIVRDTKSGKALHGAAVETPGRGIRTDQAELPMSACHPSNYLHPGGHR